MNFFVGLRQPADAKHFERAFISVTRLRGRKKRIEAREWIMDSGAFTEIATHGRYREGVEAYAEQINRWAYLGSGIVAAVAQDYMCEPWIVEKTGLSIAEHQRLTIERYDALLPLVNGISRIRELTGGEAMTAPHKARENLLGYTDWHDQLYLLHTPEFTAGITEYNDELMGYDPRLAALDPKVFEYGGNAYYIITKYAPAKGWRIEKIEDRR